MPADPMLTMALVAVLLAVTVWQTVRARARIRGPEDFYVSGRTVSAPRNSLAFFGNFLMFTSFLTMTGEIAVRGYDGVLFAVGFIVSFVVSLVLVVGPVRN